MGQPGVVVNPPCVPWLSELVRILYVMYFVFFIQVMFSLGKKNI